MSTTTSGRQIAVLECRPQTSPFINPQNTPGRKSEDHAPANPLPPLKGRQSLRLAKCPPSLPPVAVLFASPPDDRREKTAPRPKSFALSVSASVTRATVPLCHSACHSHDLVAAISPLLYRVSADCSPAGDDEAIALYLKLSSEPRSLFN